VLVNNSGTSWGAPLEQHSEKGAWRGVHARGFQSSTSQLSLSRLSLSLQSTETT
jgi:hypothetical protein